MSYFNFIDGSYYYDNPVLNFSSASQIYINVVTVSPDLLEDGKYMLDYTIKAGASKINKSYSVRILVNGILIDEWTQRSAVTPERISLTGVSKPLDLLSGVNNIELEAKTENPSDVLINTFRVSLKKWN